VTGHPIGTLQALTQAVDTMWGTYAPGTLVTVLDGTEGGWTVDLDVVTRPAHGHPHHVEIPVDAIRVWKATILHGTVQGARHHKTNSEKPCDPCAKAMADYLQSRRITAHETQAVKVSVDVLAALYLNTSMEAQELADKDLGADVIDAIITRNDNQPEQAAA
jgi:hypothetical protein